MRTQYYICSKKHDGRNCDMPTFRQVHIEKLMIDYIEKLKIEYDIIIKEVKTESDDKLHYKNELSNIDKDLIKIRDRKKKWQYMRANDEITSGDLRERLDEENEFENALTLKKEHLESMFKITDYNIDTLIHFTEIWESLNDFEKKELVYSVFSKVIVNTDLTNVKGVKNKYFDAYLENVRFN